MTGSQSSSIRQTGLNDGRIRKRFAGLKAQGRSGLVTFITAGDPDLETSRKILNGLPAAGADLIELGMPFSDPMADGPAIQLANLRALANGITLVKTLGMVAEFRKEDGETPIILMGYYNPVHCYGSRRFIDDAINAGVDGLIVVDLPPEEDDELCHPCMTAGLDWIRLTTPTSDETRLKKILRNSSGFVYHVSIAGITGTRSAALADIKSALNRIRTRTTLPIAVGFGLKTRDQIREMASVADAAVVGSALVETVRKGLENGHPRDRIVSDVHELVRDLALACG